ncbi:phosphate ABC transporter ATP-binding protein [Haploplasma axanthum]|uniref:Phosphate ABC transporter ATP-binding protein n=1 Tax=Haploplasma axanthum TaxID=29552 RepID=A0A449BD28_HAPAX|nr:ATP-binding cassette domain-containing protein [Haploplasma axanthum]VEU80327.1 phosphate ABC transporter ATP-binding protein [Haploplasma axanthum]
MKNTSVDYSKKVLEVKNLRQYFKVGSGGKKITVKAVDGVSFDVYKREVFGLVGESGCGKTTTGRTIIKLYNPTDGTVVYNNNVVGAGYEGFLYDIRKLRKEARFEILTNKPLDYKLYLLNKEYKEKINEIKKQKENFKNEFKEQIQLIKKPITDNKEELRDTKVKYKLNMSELEHQYQLSVDKIYSESVSRIIENRNDNVSLINKRAKDKTRFILSSKIEKYEKDEQVRIIEQTRDSEILYVEDKMKKELANKLNISNLDEIDLKTIKKTIVVEEKTRLKQEVLEFKEKFNEEKTVITKEFELAIEKIQSVSINKDEIDSKINSLTQESKEKIIDFDNQIKDLDNELKNQVLKTKEDAKNNPDAYVENTAKIDEIKSRLLVNINEKKKLIQEAKRQNSFRESEEDKNKRIELINSEKDRYLAEKIVISEIEDDKLRKTRSQEAKKNHQDKLNEINKLKPSHVNFLSTMQMIFQDPISSLNPRMVVGDIISEGLRIKGVTDKKEIQKRVFEMLNLVGLSKEHASRYPHEFSGGQRQRIGIARALIVNPDFIIADEPISALDVSIQAQVINLLNELKEKLGLTILFVAHDLSVVKYFSDRIAVMYFGKIVELASSEELFANPLHPYTKSLLSAIPHPDPELEKTRKRIIYDLSVHDYRTQKPTLREIKPGHFISANDAEYKKYLKELGGK